MKIDLVTSEDIKDLKKELLDAIVPLLKNTKSEEDWLKSADVRKLLGVSPGTLQTLRNTKVLPYSTIGGTIFYQRKDILAVFEKNKVNGTV